MNDDKYVETIVEKLISGGDGLARVDGMAHFIPDVLPGERVRARVIQTKKGWVRTGKPEILDPSPNRRVPFCPVYESCGGCSWQHIEYSFQVEAKVGFCKEALIRQAGMTPDSIPEIAVFSSPPKEYRARIRPIVLPNGKMAFRAARSDRPVEIKSCPVATKGINVFLADPPAELKAGTEPLVFAAGDIPFVEGVDTEAVASVKGREFRFPPNAFFQSNITILDKLVDFAITESDGGITALDLYGGVGLFGAFLADKFEHVIGVDRDRKAASAWKRHVGPRGTFHPVSIERWMKNTGRPNPDFVIVDPPRGGLDSSVCRAIANMAAPRLSYVSCDPVTLARDLKILMAKGYRLENYGVFDLYPQTPHVEIVARLVRGVSD